MFNRLRETENNVHGARFDIHGILLVYDTTRLSIGQIIPVIRRVTYAFMPTDKASLCYLCEVRVCQKKYQTKTEIRTFFIEFRVWKLLLVLFVARLKSSTL